MKKNLFKGFALSLAVATAFAGPLSGAVGSPSISALAAVSNVSTENGYARLGRGDASITINANDGNQSLLGKKFELFKLFNAENSVNGESINYTFNDEYKLALQNVVGAKLGKTPADVTEYEVIDYIQSLNNNYVEGVDAEQVLEGRYSDFRYFIEELRDEMKTLGCLGDTIIASSVMVDGSIVIDELDYGYYIVDEITANDDTHSASSLLMVNTANPDATVRVKSDYPNVIKKIQEDDADIALDSDSERWNDIADYEIGQTVPYKFTSNIPNINGYHEYYYAWHDIMDEALTFNPASVGIVISDSTKSYTLNSTEFSVNENVTVDGVVETFVVDIDDIKAIVDREFDNIDELGHNEYGQTVTLTYNATLNDKAALDTGRPGFENKVRLEFSNDADSDANGKTGYTPWDHVVCFTYKLNILKTNDHDAVLADAKFRLYSDEDCKNEVYVKESDNGYIVINRDIIGGTDHVGGTAPANAAEMVSNADGEIVILGLDDGVYYLKETDAPAGYRVILDPIKLVVTSTFTNERHNYIEGDGATDKTLKALDVDATIKTFVSGAFNTEEVELVTDIEDGSANITIVNNVGAKLPVTGSFMTVVMLGVGAAMITVSLVMVKKRREEC